MKKIKNEINISLNEFMKFVNRSGSPKITVVKEAVKAREKEYIPGADYWSFFRDRLTVCISDSTGKIKLEDVLKEIPLEREKNYKMMINGWVKYAGKKKLDWISPPNSMWNVNDLNVSVNPEIGFESRGKIYVVKLFLSVKDKLDKRHADQILSLMEKELRKKVGGNEVIFGVLDVKHGKLFDAKVKDPYLYSSLKGEAQHFETLWKAIKSI